MCGCARVVALGIIKTPSSPTWHTSLFLTAKNVVVCLLQLDGLIGVSNGIKGEYVVPGTAVGGGDRLIRTFVREDGCPQVV